MLQALSNYSYPAEARMLTSQKWCQVKAYREGSVALGQQNCTTRRTDAPIGMVDGSRRGADGGSPQYLNNHRSQLCR